jgi:glycosyltransferase involved in cell wall biosynthesis
MVVAGHKNYRADETPADGRARLGARFHYLGHVSEAKKWTLLKNANAFVFPSHYEGFGIPVVEAYQTGCPVLLAKNSSLTELAVDPRQLFASMSAAELKDRIAEVLDGASWVDRSVAVGTAFLDRFR